MKKFFMKTIILLLVLSIPIFISIVKQKKEVAETEIMDDIVQQMKKNSILCDEIIKLFEDNSPHNVILKYSDFDTSVQSDIYDKYENFYAGQQVIVLPSIEKIISNNQRYSFDRIRHRIGSYYKIPFTGNVPKGEGSYYYFKEQKLLLDHTIYLYEGYEHYKDKLQLLIEFYKYYLPFDSGFQSALNSIYN